MPTRTLNGYARRRNETRGVDFAWRVHGAQEAWTAKVDSKAAIVFAIQIALLAALIATHVDGGLIDAMQGAQRIVAEAGTASGVLAVLCSGAAVVPLLGKPRIHERDHEEHLIYFGHLRHWKPDRLVGRLQTLSPDDELTQLSHQLIQMSTRNWAKHRCLQAAMLFTLFSSLLVGAAAIAQ